MTTPATLSTIAVDVVGLYGQTAKNIVATYRAATQRAAKGLDTRYGRLINRQSLNGETKASLVDSQQRLSRLVVESVERITERATGAVDLVSNSAAQGIVAFDKQTAWANDTMVVGAIRRINLPVARLSLQVAGRVNEASQRLSQRVAGSLTAKAKRTAKATVKRARRAVRAA